MLNLACEPQATSRLGCQIRDATAALTKGLGAEGPGASKVGPPSEAKQDMLDLAYEPRATSRLGYQIWLTVELDGLVILLPRGIHNFMDCVPL
jgi:ferredoxin